MESLVRAYRRTRDRGPAPEAGEGSSREGAGHASPARLPGQGSRAPRRHRASPGAEGASAAAGGAGPALQRPDELRDHIISQHLYLVQTVARKFAGLGESHDDLLQEGAMGLINAVELFDPERGVQFSTYATHLIEGQIRHYLRDRGKLIKQPAWVQELTTKIMKASEALTQELDRPPTLTEIAARVGTSQATVQRMLEAQQRSRVASLDAARSDDDTQLPAVDSEKLRPDAPEDVHLPIEDRIFLRDAVSKLKTLERKVVHNFYYLDLNQTEIARRLGISVNYASYLLRGAVAKLKKAFEAQQQQLETTVVGAGSPRRSPWAAPRAGLGPAYNSMATADYLLERLSQEVERARRYPQQLSVMLLAPDGELTEEQFVALARLVRGNVRSIDLVARVAQQRLCLLLPHTGRESAVLAQRLVAAASARLSGCRAGASPPAPASDDAGSQPADDWPSRPLPPSPTAAGEAGPSLPRTVSIGYAVYPTDGRSAEQLLAAAQQALAEARREGGDRAVRSVPVSNSGTTRTAAA